MSHVPCKRSRWCCAAYLILCVLNGTQGGASGTQNPLKRVKKPTCRNTSPVERTVYVTKPDQALLYDRRVKI